MRMRCPGDENIIPLYRPVDATPDIATSTSKSSDTVENITETQVSVAAPKQDMGTDMTSEANITKTEEVSVAAPKSDKGTGMTFEEQRRLIREEKNVTTG